MQACSKQIELYHIEERIMIMKKSVKGIALLLAVLFVLPVLVACGNKTDDNGDGNKTADKVTAKVININLTDEDYAFGVDKDQPELLAKTNEFIQEIVANGKFDEICNRYFGDGEPTPVTSAELDTSKDQLVVATNAGFEPFEYMDGDKYVGIDMEIAALLAKELGKELVINNMEFDAVCTSVGQHKCDIAMAGLTVNESRKEYVEFSDSYYKASQQIIVPSNNTEFDACKTADDVVAILNGKDASTKIGVQNGTTGQKYLQGDAEWEFDGFKVSCIGYKNGSLAVQDMLNGNLDFVVIDAAPAKCITDSINKLA